MEVARLRETRSSGLFTEVTDSSEVSLVRTFLVSAIWIDENDLSMDEVWYVVSDASNEEISLGDVMDDAKTMISYERTGLSTSALIRYTESVTLDSETLSLSVGGSYVLTATVAPEGVAVTWFSSNIGVATVSAEGMAVVMEQIAVAGEVSGEDVSSIVVNVSASGASVVSVTCRPTRWTISRPPE